MVKKLFVCDLCHRQVRDLEGHKARVHAQKQPQIEPTSEPKSPTQPGKGVNLRVKTPSKQSQKAEVVYHCVDCGASVNKGDTHCGSCGCELFWAGVNNEN